MAFTVLLIFLPLAGFLYLDVYETELLRSQENGMAAQARMAASALEAWLATESQSGPPAVPDSGTAPAGLTTPARALVRSLGSRSVARIRILDADLSVIADSAGPATGDPEASPMPEGYLQETDRGAGTPPEEGWLYWLGSLPFRLLRALSPPAPEYALPAETTLPRDNPAALRALGGTYGSWTAISRGQRSVTLHSAMPVMDPSGRTVGVVMESQSTWHILASLYRIRISIFQVFLTSMAVALVVGLLFSLTITRPLRRMERMSREYREFRGGAALTFTRTGGPREVRSLSESLVALQEGINRQMEFVARFPRDLAHEARNPLAGIRAAAELLGRGSDEKTRMGLTSLITGSVDRLDRLLDQCRELSTLDVEAAAAPRTDRDPSGLIRECLEPWMARGAPVAMEEAPLPPGNLRVNPALMARALDALVENALGFSPPGAMVTVRIAAGDHGRHHIRVEVEDAGPGFPPGDLSFLGEPFRTTRRDHRHAGLGLSFAVTITRAFGGTVTFANTPGARITLTFPLVPRTA